MTEVIVIPILIVGLAIFGVVCITIAVKKATPVRTPEVSEQSVDAWGLEAGPASLLSQHEKPGSPSLDVDPSLGFEQRPRKIDVWETEEERVRRLWGES